MNYYYAPMEGITDYIYRNAHHAFFRPADKYFTPFITTHQTGKYHPGDIKGILPEHNQGLTVIPQLLTNHADQFVHAVQYLKSYGYEEVNLNLGCPSATVAAKGKGSGFLSRKEELNRFLETICSDSPLKISIKTRLGIENPEEFYEILKIYNQYPLEELIIHPRTQKDFYKNKPHLDIFKDALALSSNPVCYNGDIFTVKDFETFSTAFPTVDTLMLGRGLVVNPGLIHCIEGHDGTLDMKTSVKQFHDKIYNDYREILFGERNVLFRMKELWCYMVHLFTNYERYSKKINKSQRLADYEEIVTRLFEEQDIVS